MYEGLAPPTALRLVALQRSVAYRLKNIMPLSPAID